MRKIELTVAKSIIPNDYPELYLGDDKADLLGVLMAISDSIDEIIDFLAPTPKSKKGE